ncbi:MAG: 16S rRNA (cytosine(1402)-N(4))-methyltransferase RsmH [Defluviitaleaceae bacterium]|nr:16S rRNA (cytosine(1402)-N(4))-methyltransferase RsmH [Defluviitaleaceae bacterium]
MEMVHKSVLLDEAIDALDIKPDGVYVDATLGGAGHAIEIVKRLGNGILAGVDQDVYAIGKATQALAAYAGKVCIVHSNFSNVEHIMAEAQISHADGVLMDLGVSSFQLDDGARGFSYNHDAPLDMRMDKHLAISAHDVVNKYDEARLSKIFRDYGEERWAVRIAKFIVDARAKAPIDGTAQLVDIIKAAIPKAARSDGPHPAKRVFQAIRIEVNSELSILETAIKNFVDALRPGGRICIITFHSLEDRIVKNTFRALATSCTCPREFPVCICNKQPVVDIVTKRPIVPSNEEIAQNPRARSAKLRVAQKI